MIKYCKKKVMPISKKEVAFCRSVANLGSWVEDTCETKFPSSGFQQTSTSSTKATNHSFTKETDRRQTSQQVYKKQQAIHHRDKLKLNNANIQT